MVRALGRRLGQDHKHDASGEGGTTVNPDTLASLDLTGASSGIPVEPDGSGGITTGAYPSATGESARIEKTGSAQSISSASTTQVTFNNNQIETDNTVLEADTTNDRVTIKETGVYRVHAVLTWAGSSNWSTGDRISFDMRLDGNTPGLGETRTQHGGANEMHGFACTALANVTSTNGQITATARQESGSSENIVAESRYTYLEVTQI